MSTLNLQKFAERLRARRNHVGMTPAQLAAATEISERSIWDYESRKGSPNAEKILRICEALTCRPGWLLGEDPVATSTALREAANETHIADALANVTEIREQLDSLERRLNAMQAAPELKRVAPADLKGELVKAHPLRSEVSVREPKAASPTGNKPAPRPRTLKHPSTPPSAPVLAPTAPES